MTTASRELLTLQEGIQRVAEIHDRRERMAAATSFIAQLEIETQAAIEQSRVQESGDVDALASRIEEAARLIKLDGTYLHMFFSSDWLEGIARDVRSLATQPSVQGAVSEVDAMNAIVEAYNTWPADIRKKLSLHDLRRMTGWKPLSATPRTDAGVDVSGTQHGDAGRIDDYRTVHCRHPREMVCHDCRQDRVDTPATPDRQALLRLADEHCEREGCAAFVEHSDDGKKLIYGADEDIAKLLKAASSQPNNVARKMAALHGATMKVLDEWQPDMVPRSRLEAIERELQEAKDKLVECYKQGSAEIKRLTALAAATPDATPASWEASALVEGPSKMADATPGQRALLEAATELRDLVQEHLDGHYKIDSLTLQPINDILGYDTPQPAAQPGQGEADVVSEDVHRVMDEGDGYWHSCSGCHETNEGHQVQGAHFSKIFLCYLGTGCAECGGLGAVWESAEASATPPPARSSDEAHVMAIRHRVGSYDGLDITPAQVRSVLKHDVIEAARTRGTAEGG